MTKQQKALFFLWRQPLLASCIFFNCAFICHRQIYLNVVIGIRHISVSLFCGLLLIIYYGNYNELWGVSQLCGVKKKETYHYAHCERHVKR